MKTFTCNFGAGVTCTIKVADTPPAKAQAHVRECVWTGKPTRTTLRPYIAWVNQVNSQLAAEWGIKFIHVFQTATNAFESWIYEPGQPAQKLTPNPVSK